MLLDTLVIKYKRTGVEGARARRVGSTSVPLCPAAGPLSSAGRAGCGGAQGAHGGTGTGSGSGDRGRSPKRWRTSGSSCSGSPCCRETLKAS